MQTAYCRQHEPSCRIQPIVKAAVYTKEGKREGRMIVHVTLACGARSNIVMSNRNYAEVA